MLPQSTHDLFWAKVEKTDGCWLWTGMLAWNGYGLFYVAKRLKRAHRIAYAELAGPIPEGLSLDHLCRVRHCVNPAHLEPVPNRTNVLRGEGITAQNARKTECIRGHALSPDNTRWSNGTRKCRACDKLRSARKLRSVA